MNILQDNDYTTLDVAMENLKGKRKRQKVIDWAESAALNHGLLENVLKGHMEIVDYDDEQGPKFQLTKRGIDTVERMIASS